MNNEYKLCYVSGSWAWFTTQSPTEQWGDDWDDAPYEHNAGEPYDPCWHNEQVARNNPESKRGNNPMTGEPLGVGEMCRCVSCVRDWNDDGSPKWSICKIAFDAALLAPCDITCGGNSRYSVQQINAGAIAWLVSIDKNGVVIPAGTPLDRFCELVRLAGGQVYLPQEAT